VVDPCHEPISGEPGTNRHNHRYCRHPGDSNRSLAFVRERRTQALRTQFGGAESPAHCGKARADKKRELRLTSNLNE